MVKTKAQRAHCKKVATELAKKGTSASGRALARCTVHVPAHLPAEAANCIRAPVGAHAEVIVSGAAVQLPANLGARPETEGGHCQ